jgi:hypothetical protein
MLGLYEERYSGFTVKHLHDQLQQRHSHKLGYNFYTPKAGEPVSRTVRMRVSRAMARLGIRHIAGYSPEALGLSGSPSPCQL